MGRTCASCAVMLVALLTFLLSPASADLLVERATYDAGAKVHASAAVVDLDGDGSPAIVFVTAGGDVVAMTADGTPKWVARGMAKMAVPPAVADLLPEPGLELIAADWKGRVRCLNARGRVLWETRIGEMISWSSPAILGLRGPGLRSDDGPRLIVVGDETGGFCALSRDGKIVWRHAAPSGVSIACPPAVGDIDGDGAQEIVFGAQDGIIRCLTAKGHEKWIFKTNADAYTGPVIADLDGDGHAEVVTASGDGFVYVLGGRSGDLVWKFDSGAPVDSSLAIADVVPETGPEVLFVNTDGDFYCLSARGEKLWSQGLGARAVAPPCIADLDADGMLELIVGDHAGTLHVLSAAGEPLEQHQLTGRLNATPTVVLGPRGLSLVVPDEGGKVHVFLAPASASGAAVAWSGFRGDPAGRADVRAFAREVRVPIRITRADPGSLLMGDGVFRVMIGNDAGGDVIVTLEVAAPENRTFSMQRRQGTGEESYELAYEILARGEYRFSVNVQPASGKAAPARYERGVHIVPFARDEAEIARLLGRARDAAIALRAAGSEGARHVLMNVDDIGAGIAELDLPRFDSIAQSERRDVAGQFAALLERARQLAKKARFALAAGDSEQRGFAAWAVEPYADFDANAVPAGEAARLLSVTLCRGERHPVALNILSSRIEPLPLRVLPGNLKRDDGGAAIPAQQALTLRRVVFAPSRDGKLYPDALPRLDAINSVTVPPWEAAQIWITVDATGLDSGVYRGEIALDPITPGIETQTVPLEITVRSLALQGRSPLASCQWAYLHAGTTADKMQEAADDLLAHHTTVYPFVGASTAPPKADAAGNLLEALDFTAHDALFELYHRPKGWLLYLTGSPRLSSAVEMFSPAWEKLCATWLKGMAEHAQSLGLDYTDWAWYPIDEAGKKLIPDLLRAAKFAKSVDPRIQMYYDFFQGSLEVSLADLKRLDPYIDIWQPHRGIVEEQTPEDVERMDFLRSTGEAVWTYDTSGSSHALSPVGYYRSQGWLAWDKRISGVGFWTYNSTGTDQWQERNDREYLAIYQGREIVPSKRWEAYRDGIEDYWVLSLLRQAGEQARAVGRRDLADQAEQAIASAVAAVMSDRENPQVYEAQRRITAELTEEIVAALASAG
ncbi:MAG: PQQ-binding-like beta-propeller repeat protein [Armatimonadota bacterium]|nr:MAG: PQQ-binding-like beta-propeller repeat protein [Armatimonadota bacterium]